MPGHSTTATRSRSFYSTSSSRTASLHMQKGEEWFVPKQAMSSSGNGMVLVARQRQASKGEKCQRSTP